MNAIPVSTGQRILNAAAELMLARGPRKVTMEEVAAAIGISKKTLYQEYSSKSDLVHALARREFDTWDAKRDALIEDHPEVVDLLHALARYNIEAHRRFGPEVRRDLQADYPDIWEDLRVRRMRHNGELEILIERGIAEGHLKPVNPTVAAIALRAALARATEPDTVQAHSFTADQAAADVYDLFLHGLLTRSGAAALQGAT